MQNKEVRKMRIIIEVDGVEVTAITVPPQITTAAFPRVSTAVIEPTAPPKVLAAAAARGARNAGPAPTVGKALGVPIFQIPLIYRGVPVAGPGGMDAGKAPSTSPDLVLQKEDE